MAGVKAAWTKANPERARLLWRRGHAKNRERRNALRRARYFRALAADPIHLWEQKRASKMRLKLKILAHYGNGVAACVTCQVADPDVLTLDHINNDGFVERRGNWKGYASGHTAHREIRKRGYPPGYQTLCSNCNLKKHILHQRAQSRARVEAKAAR